MKYHQLKKQYNLFLHKTDSIGYVAQENHKEFTFNIPNFKLSKNAKLTIDSITSTGANANLIFNIRCKNLNPFYNFDSKRDYPLIYSKSGLTYEGYNTYFYTLSNSENLNSLTFVVTFGLGDIVNGINTNNIDFMLKISLYDEEDEEVKDTRPVKNEHYDNKFFPH